MPEKNYGIVIVTFNPEPKRIERIAKIAMECSNLVIVDNGSPQHTRQALSEISKSTNIEVILNPQNLGLARALNQGVHYFLNINFEWLFTLDQDSVPLNSSMDHLFEGAKKYWLSGRKGIFTLNSIEEVITKKDKPASDQQVQDEFITVKTSITSGSLFNAEIFDRVGFFDESFFIDYIDHEYCLRAARHGYLTYKATNLLMLHNSGSPTRSQLLGVSIFPQNYSAERLYFKTRNRLRVYRSYYNTDLLWLLKDFWGFTKEFTKIILLEKEKTKKILSILVGCKDGLGGKMEQGRDINN